MKCMSCGAPVDDLRFYCLDCEYGLKDERDILNPYQDVCEDAQEEKNQDVIQQASEESQPTYEQELANALDRLQIRLYLAQRGMERGGLIFLGGVFLTIAAYFILGSTSGLYLVCLGPVIFGVIDFLRGAFRYNKYKKALAEFTDEHAAILDDLKAILTSDVEDI
jgi:hypothetical protein